jgi:hypothetical protein
MPKVKPPTKIKLTQAAASRLKPPTDCVNKTYWDSQCPGFGLRISAKNRRTWIALYRVNGRSVMETLSTMAKMTRLMRRGLWPGRR